MIIRTCINCGQEFIPSPRVSFQSYCSKYKCQAARRVQWQSKRLHEDADYRDNQKRAQQRWRANHPEYWSDYRSTHPEYTQRNREAQRMRNIPALALDVISFDQATLLTEWPSGIFRLREITRTAIAKMDVIDVVSVAHFSRVKPI